MKQTKRKKNDRERNVEKREGRKGDDLRGFGD